MPNQKCPNRSTPPPPHLDPPCSCHLQCWHTTTVYICMNIHTSTRANTLKGSQVCPGKHMEKQCLDRQTAATCWSLLQLHESPCFDEPSSAIEHHQHGPQPIARDLSQSETGREKGGSGRGCHRDSYQVGSLFEEPLKPLVVRLLRCCIGSDMHTTGIRKPPYTYYK